MKVGLLHSLIRKEEKLLVEEFRSRSEISLSMLDVRDRVFDLIEPRCDLDVAFQRCMDYSRALHSTELLERVGVKCVNTSEVAAVCGDKLLTSVALKEQGVPQPDVRVAFTEESALEALEDMGYPAVIKPSVGSWGRLLSKVNDRDAAESILEHKRILGTYHHSIFYIQKYIEKRNKDIRAFVIGNECVAAIYRSSPHWITNTARGGAASNCAVTDEIRDISLKAARAVGGGVVAVDLLEAGEGLLVNEINNTMEFKNSIDTTGVNIPKLIVDFVLRAGRGEVEL